MPLGPIPSTEKKKRIKMVSYVWLTGNSVSVIIRSSSLPPHLSDTHQSTTVVGVYSNHHRNAQHSSWGIPSDLPLLRSTDSWYKRTFGKSGNLMPNIMPPGCHHGVVSQHPTYDKPSEKPLSLWSPPGTNLSSFPYPIISSIIGSVSQSFIRDGRNFWFWGHSFPCSKETWRIWLPFRLG